jgi:hypothetical protein
MKLFYGTLSLFYDYYDVHPNIWVVLAFTLVAPILLLNENYIII